MRGIVPVWIMMVVGLPTAGEVIKEGDYRILRIRACADEELRSRTEWQREVREHLEFASNLYERTFNIRFVIVELVEWASDDAGEGLGDLVEELEQEIPLDGVDVVIGFSAQQPQRGKLSKYISLPWGLTPSFGRVSVIRAMIDDESYDLHLAVVHEIAHLFGAFHVADQDSVMRETIQGPRTFQFDIANGRMVRLMRDYDFEAGVEAISPETAKRITKLWWQSGRGIDTSPLAEALYNRGIELHNAGKISQAMALWQQAIEADDRLGSAYASLGLTFADQGDYEMALQNLRKADECGWPKAKQLIHLILHRKAQSQAPAHP
ncbi:MAG: M12 family metallo-peptidase [Candidatus Zipacnadales bacterium]